MIDKNNIKYSPSLQELDVNKIIRNSPRLQRYILNKCVDKIYRFVGEHLHSEIDKPNIEINVLDSSKQPKLIKEIKRLAKERIKMDYSNPNLIMIVLGAIRINRKTNRSCIFLFKDSIFRFSEARNIPKRSVLIKVLIHEVLHLYQKLLNKQIIKEDHTLNDDVTNNVLSKFLRGDKNA